MMLATLNKLCSLCKKEKPTTAFSFRDKARGFLQSRCKTCCAVEFKRYRELDITKERFRQYRWHSRPENRATAAENQKKRRAEKPEQEFKKKRKSWLKKQFGLSVEDYECMLAAQNGVCAICGTDKPSSHRTSFYVDHCHKTNKVRALLCGSCNTGLGHFKDNKTLLTAAAAYLEKHQ